ncbi:hypothetical protein G7Y79_00002g005040 [Physcia stellaris]|nr:hypothetical protein G7Y79_00002g005040 [Physcia stellaris]
MSRRGPPGDFYEERDREYYTPRRGNRVAEYDEIDIRERRRGADREPDFLREDYGRSSTAGALVLRQDRRESIEAQPRRRDREVVETDEVYISRPAKESERDRPKVKTVQREEPAYRRSRVPTETSYDREEIIYRERDRERYSPPPQQVAREREEFVYRQRERERYSPPPPQIAREHEEFIFRKPTPREPSYEREEIIIREGERERERPREREYRDEEVIIRRDERERERPKERDYKDQEIIIRRDERDYDDEQIIIRREERERARPKERDRGYEQEEIIIRDRSRNRPRAASYERESLTIRSDDRPRAKSRDFREEEITIRRDEREKRRPRSPESSYREEDIIIRRNDRETPRRRSPERDYREEDIIIRRNEREKAAPRRRSLESRYRDDELVVRKRDHSRETARTTRDEEDIIIRHDESKGRHKDEIIIRRNERSPSPEPYVPPLPPPSQNPFELPRFTRKSSLIIAISTMVSKCDNHPPQLLHHLRRNPDLLHQQKTFNRLRYAVSNGERNGRHYDEDIVIDSGPRRREERPPPRRRSPSIGAHSHAYPSRDEREIAEEADYYNERTRERGYIGEGYNGATRDWAIVDVPPGTRRVEMEGVGGAHQEVTWQRYNGVRRSKFIAEDDAYEGALVEAPPPVDTRDRGRRFVGQKSKTEGMWTEITKDLVSEEAMKEMGYEYEETEFFYYVMSYLRYEDVQRLVDLSEDIKKGRRSRIREIQFEREAPRKKQLALGWDEERVIEREVIYDGPPPRRYR